MTFQEQVEKYVESLLTGDLMTADANTAHIEQVVQAWVLLKYTGERIEARLKEIRKVLLDRAEQFGQTTEKGGSKLQVDGTLVLREKRTAALPDEKKVRDMLESAGLKPTEAFSKVTKVVLDASKVDALVSLGKLDEDEVEKAKKVTWALRVKESFDLADILEATVGQAGEEIVESAPKQKRSKAAGSRKKGA
jgi:hypothetical protein